MNLTAVELRNYIFAFNNVNYKQVRRMFKEKLEQDEL